MNWFPSPPFCEGSFSRIRIKKTNVHLTFSTVVECAELLPPLNGRYAILKHFLVC